MNIEHAAPNHAQESTAEPVPSSPSESFVFTSSRYAAKPPIHQAKLSPTLRSIHANGATDVKRAILTDIKGFVPLSISPSLSPHAPHKSAESNASSPTSDYFSSRPPRQAPPTSHVQQWLDESASARSFSPSAQSVSDSPSISTPSSLSPQSGVSPFPSRRNQTDLSLTELFTFSGSFGKPRPSIPGLTLVPEERRKQARSSSALPREGRHLSKPKTHAVAEDKSLNKMQKPAAMPVRVFPSFITSAC